MNCKFIYVACLLLFTDFIAQSQSIVFNNKVDTLTHTLTSSVFFQNIPAKSKARWQQRLPAHTAIINIDKQEVWWDTTENLLSVIWKDFPDKDVVTYTFTLKILDTTLHSISLGDGAFIYVDNENKTKKITTKENYISILNACQVDSLSFYDTIYYIQVGVGAKGRQREFRLHENDQMFTIEMNHSCKYQVGPYYSLEQAKSKLSFYRNYVKDAFIVKKIK
ncbi:MAG: hypothetical protein GX330_01005 [Bacteroidales bacterium]|nr:hypothetical protein [Bacteroidales bacterium]